MIRRRTFLIKRLAFSSINKTFQYDGSIANACERAGRDRQVVAHEFEF